MTEVTIVGDTIRARSPEGQEATMRLADFMTRLMPASQAARSCVLPDGVKKVFARGPLLILVHETKPRVHRFQWIAKGSAKRFGAGTAYRSVCLALPYVIVFAVFQIGSDGQPVLFAKNECFFRTTPLKRAEMPDGELLYPGLLNISRFDPPEGHPLAWICTQHLDWRAVGKAAGSANDRLRRGLTLLLHCLFETRFNESSEEHEGASWYGESRQVDERIATVERWEQESQKNPLLGLEIPWLKTGLSITDLAERIFKNAGLGNRSIQTADDLARIVFNNHAPEKPHE